VTATAAPSPVPIVRTVEVAVPPARAFEVFTARLSDWWPLNTHSVFGERAQTLQMVPGVGGEIVERSRTGEVAVWGTALVWEEGVEVGFTWHPGAGPEHATRVHVRFEPVDAGAHGARSHVVVVHGGWEHRTDDPIAYRVYQSDWDAVLRLYADEAAA
jgi:uncharacterized protein YndB with AHSA1/START domain